MGYKWSLTTTVFLYTLTILGSLVVGLNAVLACPNWPLCGNSLLPPLNGPVLVEYFHRLLTLITTLLLLYNAWRAWRKRRDRLTRVLALASIALLGTQIAFGAIIVLLILPGSFTTVDVANSMVLLASVAALTAIGVKEKRDARVTATDSVVLAPSGRPLLQEQAAALRNPAIFVAVATFAETLIGGYFRHSGASQALFGQNSYLLSHHQDYMPSYDGSMFWLGIHIASSAVVGVAVVWLIARALKQQAFVKSSIMLGILLVYQMLLGFVTLASSLALSFDTLHWAGAVAMVALSAFLLTAIWLELPKRTDADDATASPSIIL